MSLRMLQSVRGVGQIPGCAAAMLTLLSACQTNHTEPGTEQVISQATGIADAVMFRVEAAPIDETTEASELSLADAIRLAVTTDPGVQAALARVRIAMADADQARLVPNPVLNIVLRWGPGKPQIEASLAQDIVRTLQTPRRASAADNRLKRTAAEALTVALDTAEEVQERYSAVQSADRLIPHLEAQVSILERLSEVARSRVNAGEGVPAEVATLEAQRVELEVALAAARLSQREARLRLARIIGEPSGAATWTLDDWTPPPLTFTPERCWIEVALQHRPEVQSIAWELAALGDDFALTRLLPWEGSQIGIDSQRDDRWSTGSSVSSPIPVFDAGQPMRARVTALQIEARHNLTQVRRKVVEDVRVAYQALIGNTANLRKVREELVPLQRHRLQIAEERYRAGLADVTVFFLTEHDLRAAETKAIEIEQQTTLALIRLQRAVGGPGVLAASSFALDPHSDHPLPRNP